MKYLLLSLLLLAGCSTIQLQCPSTHVVTAQINGPDYAGLASQILQILGPFIAPGALGTRDMGASPAATIDGTVTIKTLDFGTQSYSCGNAAAPAKATVPTVQQAPAPPPSNPGPVAGNFPMAIVR